MAQQTDKILAVLDYDDEIVYRILRTDERIVYIRVISTDLIEIERRVHGESAMRQLRMLPMWNDRWETLEVRTVENGVSYKLDAWEPHTIPEKYLLPYLPRCDQSVLPILKETHQRTCEIDHDSIPSIMKVANFPFQVPLMVQELEIYHALGGSPLAPRLHSYVVESHNPERVIGFVIDKLKGRYPGPMDLVQCAKALRHLHQVMLHGNLKKHHMIVTPTGVKFISFKNAQLSSEDNVLAREQERRRLPVILGAASERPRCLK